MATHIILVTVGLRGETQNREYQGEGGIDLIAWSWGMSQSGTTHLGPGAGSGKVSVNDITFTKYVDLSTPVLMKACASGRSIPKATLYVRKATGDTPIDYVKLEMDTIIVSSYNTGGGADGLDRVQETLSFNFRKFRMTYTQQSATGAASGGVDMGWDIAENASI